ncbi:hypothetical protein LBMAG57_30020 [Verrucomicrobiota bacterium]|nr:hypothetical protein LBMAG57_30020 [Verrucomicrobiota bacterium]
MKITAITRYKHGALYEMLQRLGWSQSELAKRSGISTGGVGQIMNLNRRPSVAQANAIQAALGAAGEYLDVLSEWPETFKGLRQGYKVEQTAEVEMENLLGCHEALRLEAPQPEDTSEIDCALDGVLADLTSREQGILKERYWNRKTLEQVGDQFRICGNRVREIEARALRKLRHPLRIKKLVGDDVPLGGVGAEQAGDDAATNHSGACSANDSSSATAAGDGASQGVKGDESR